MKDLEKAIKTAKEFQYWNKSNSDISLKFKNALNTLLEHIESSRWHKVEEELPGFKGEPFYILVEKTDGCLYIHDVTKAITLEDCKFFKITK